jgi:hypothetical protein
MRPAPDREAFQGAISGDVVLPGSPDYESARKPAIARFHDVWPEAIVLCSTPADVSGTVSFARRSGLQTATRSHERAVRPGAAAVAAGLQPRVAPLLA